MPSVTDLLSIAPQLILSVVAMAVLLLDVSFPRISKRFLAVVSVIGLAGAGVVAWRQWPGGHVTDTLQGMIRPDAFNAFFAIVLCFGTALSILLSTEYLERNKEDHGEYYALMLFTTVGGLVMAASVNLICIFIGLEILSISLYILAGYESERLESDESAMKYFLLGAFASAFFLYGIALVYGATGSLNLTEIGKGLGVDPAKNFLLLAGIAMMIVGFGFKVAVVPFHIWTPDVYEGAPTSVTAFMSVGAKVAGFAAFLRVIVSAFPDTQLQLQISAVLASVAALTMLVGNVVAVVQTNIKRMLAYSSIAHAGYILTGLVAAVRPGTAFGSGSEAQAQAVSAVLFYLLAYTVSNLGAFGVVLALRKRGAEVREISDLAGIGHKYPGLAALMSLFLLSLAGLPPTCGFFGKLFLLRALVSMNTPLPWLIVLFVLTSVVSFYYYLGPVKTMYMDPAGAEASRDTVQSADWGLRVALGGCAIGTVVIGLWATGAITTAQSVAQAFFAAGQ